MERCAKSKLYFQYKQRLSIRLDSFVSIRERKQIKPYRRAATIQHPSRIQPGSGQVFHRIRPFVSKVLAWIEEGAGRELYDSERDKLGSEIEAILRQCLEDGTNSDMFFVRNQIRSSISMFPNSSEYFDSLMELQQELERAARDFLDLDDLVIPCVIFTGDQNQLPDVFANLNQGGTKLSKYQVLAAHWTRFEITLPRGEYCDAILARVIERYQYLIEARDLEILEFDRSEMEDTRRINLSEYCYALGELIIEKTPVFWSATANSDFDKREDSCNVLGYLTAAIALGVDNRTIAELPSKIDLFEGDGFVEELTRLIIGEYLVIQNEFSGWLTVPGTTEKTQYESSAITDMQALSFFAALWHKRYFIDSKKKKVETIEHYRDKGYSQTRSNLISHCVSDIVNKSWQGSGDSRLANYYVKDTDTPNSYYLTISESTLLARLNTWYEEVTQKASINPEKISRMLLCIATAQDKAHFNADKYDIEHIVSKQALKENGIYTSENISGGALGNLMYLKEKTNRGKKRGM